MQIIIKATNMELSDELKSFINKKIEGCEKFTHTKFPIEARCEVGKINSHHKKGYIFRAEVNLRLPGKLLRAEAIQENIYAAINKVKNELKGKIKKYERK